MKIACSSASFARSFADGTMTQLEWLDVCANELEVDGVVFDTRHFPRTDDDYLAQLKKSAADLALTIAGVATESLTDARDRLALATALGAPLLLCAAPPATADTPAWGAFADAAKDAAGAAKRANVTLAVRCTGQTLCESSADLKRLAKDVDSAWLRFAWSEAGFRADGVPSPLLAKAVIATHDIVDIERFATTSNEEAARLVAALARFRGFVTIDYPTNGARCTSLHAALARFARYRAAALVTVL